MFSFLWPIPEPELLYHFRSFSQEISQTSTCPVRSEITTWGQAQAPGLHGPTKQLQLRTLPQTTTGFQILTTGVYFTLTLQSQPNSIVIPSKEVSAPQSTYINLTPITSDYKPGGTLFNSTLWRFTQSTQSGNFILTNKAVPNAVVSFVSDFMGLKSLQITTDPAYQVGGAKYQHSLWKLVQSEQSGFYRLKLTAFPNGVITYKQQWTQSTYHLVVEGKICSLLAEFCKI